MLPVWVQAVMAAAALVGATGVLWRKIVLPGYRLARAADELAPLLRDFTHAFKDTPHVFLILDEIADQFRTDSGSSLRDAVDRLETATQALHIRAEASRQLSAEDRKTLALLELLLDKLDLKADAAAVIVAEGQDRADAAEGEDAGEAADAAARSE